jgi:transposase
MNAYPVELRSRIVQAVARGVPRAEVAEVFAVSRRTISRYVAQARRGQSLTPRQSPGRPPAISPDQAATLHAQVAAHPDATLADHCAVWEREQDGRVSVATMSRAIRALGITVKKSPLRGRAG